MSSPDPAVFAQMLQAQLPQLVDSLLVGTGQQIVRDRVNGMIAFAIGQMPGNSTFVDAIAATIGQRITTDMQVVETQVAAMLQRGEDKLTAKFTELDQNLGNLKSQSVQIEALFGELSGKMASSGAELNRIHKNFEDAIKDMHDKIELARATTQSDRDIIAREF